MNEILFKIGRVIESVARYDNNALDEISSEGIFFMPELAFVFSCGKAIMLERADVFSGFEVTWKREENHGNGGPTDLVFELKKNGGLVQYIAIEFKLRNTWNAYLKDIDKLLTLKNNNPEIYTVAFCALVDTFTRQYPDDGRVGKIEAYDAAKAKVTSLLEPKPYFPTKQTRYPIEPVSCVVGFWSIDLPL